MTGELTQKGGLFLFNFVSMKSTVKKGMGFKAAQSAIAKKQGISKERAGAILAVGARKASPKAKMANPNLKKVLMKKGK